MSVHINFTIKGFVNYAYCCPVLPYIVCMYAVQLALAGSKSAWNVFLVSRKHAFKVLPADFGFRKDIELFILHLKKRVSIYTEFVYLFSFITISFLSKYAFKSGNIKNWTEIIKVWLNLENNFYIKIGK